MSVEWQPAAESAGPFQVRHTGFLAVDLQPEVLQFEIGNLFGQSDEIFAVTSNEEHSYNAQSEIWLLPASGEPRLLLAIGGDFEKFSPGASGGVPGVTVARQTYDGVRAETKGMVDEFYSWDSGAKSLTLRK